MLGTLRRSSGFTDSVSYNSLYDKYRAVANECKQAILDYDIACEMRVLEANNLGAFYRFVNGKMGRRSGIAPLLDASGCLQYSDQMKADLLNEFFFRCSRKTTADCRISNPEFLPTILAYVTL